MRLQQELVHRTPVGTAGLQLQLQDVRMRSFSQQRLIPQLNGSSYLTDILVHLLHSEWLVLLIVAKEPESRCLIVLVISDVKVIGARLQQIVTGALGRRRSRSCLGLGQRSLQPPNTYSHLSSPWVIYLVSKQWLS